MPTIEGEDLRVHAERPLVQTQGQHIIPEAVDSRDADPDVVAHEAKTVPVCSVWICQSLKPN